MDWYRVYKCVVCQGEMSITRLSSISICPHCGKVSGTSTVDCCKGFRKRITPWWKLWNRKYETKWEIFEKEE